MAYQLDNKIHIFNIYRIKNEEGKWCPGIEDVQDHEITPAWVASVMYNMYSRYIDSIPEESQIDFDNEVKKYFKLLMESGENFVDKIDNQL